MCTSKFTSLRSLVLVALLGISPGVLMAGGEGDSDGPQHYDSQSSSQESEAITIELQRSIAESEKNLVIGSSAPINLKKKPCAGCNCGRANNITLDIEDIGK